MKALRILIALGLGLMACSFATAAASTSLLGAWRISGNTEKVLIVTPTYWTQATFDREGRKFVNTFGGGYTLNDGVAAGKIEFNSEAPDQVGTAFQVRLKSEADTLSIVQDDGTTEVWKRIDDGKAPLAGTWRISSRHVDGEMKDMPLRARRTLKILSGTRFQWVAMNIETGEFSGTGGGTYTFKDGKYVETIEFFSRDASRVGARLEFDGKVSGDTWEHKGLSSKGDPIHEIWSRFDTEQK